MKYSNGKELSGKATLENQTGSLDLTVKPEKFNTNDTDLQLKVSTNYQPVEDKYDASLGFRHGSPQLGPVRLFTTVSALPLSFSIDLLIKL